jgi:hypothetical protein
MSLSLSFTHTNTLSHTHTHLFDSAAEAHTHTHTHSVDKSSGLEEISVGAEAQDLPMTGCVAGEAVCHRGTPRSIASMDFSVSTHKCLHADTGGNHGSTFVLTGCPKTGMCLNYVTPDLI